MSRTPLPPSESFAARMTDGAEFIIRRHGNQAGPRLIISHGNGFAVDGYRVFWEPLLADFDVVLFDMRNHGQNQPTGADGHNYQQMATDIATVREAVTKQWGEKTTVGVFHSMSARAAMKQAIQMGWIWDALVLFDPPNVPPRDHPVYPMMRTFEMKLVEFSANRPDSFPSIEAMIQAYSESRASSGWVPESWEDMARSVLRQAPDGSFKLTCLPELEAAIYLAALTLNLWPKATEYGGPVKLIAADPAAKKSPTATANQALAQEQGYLYEAVAGTGHLLQLEKPQESRDAMLSFLKDLGIAR